MYKLFSLREPHPVSLWRKEAFIWVNATGSMKLLMVSTLTSAAMIASYILLLVEGFSRNCVLSVVWVLFRFNVDMRWLFCVTFSLWLFSFFLPNPGDVPGWLPSSTHWRQESVEISAGVQQRLSVVWFRSQHGKAWAETHRGIFCCEGRVWGFVWNRQLPHRWDNKRKKRALEALK